ncbi:hypothetical protein FRC11_008749 [Ceratobasidium sp. 423]|nr:hypothetical protein FRC11_008749 [Ceratobasidium sp. 423]
MSKKLAANGLRSPHSQLRLQSWGVPGSPNHVTLHRSRSVTTPMQVLNGWTNKSLDSIQSQTPSSTGGDGIVLASGPIVRCGSRITTPQNLQHSHVPFSSPTILGPEALPKQILNQEEQPDIQDDNAVGILTMMQDISIGSILTTSSTHKSSLTPPPPLVIQARKDVASLDVSKEVDSPSLQQPALTQGSAITTSPFPTQIISKPGLTAVFWNQGKNIPRWHSTQPRVETYFYPISDVLLEEDSGSDFDELVAPEQATWTMQDYETQQYKAINVSAEQYAFVLQQSLDLQQATVWHQEILEENPIYSLISGGLLETATVDWLALYLQQLVYHSPNLEGQVFITLPSRNQALLCDPSGQTAFPWLSSEPPNRMLIPIIQPSTVGTAGHYYMYHVVFDDLGSNPPANFYYIDSLGRAPTEAMEQDRDLQALELVRRMLPNCEGIEEWEWDTVEWHQGCPPNFRQAPGSVDCGLFICQALSALAFDHCLALETPLEVDKVRSRLVWLMEQFGFQGVQLGSDTCPPIWLLPLHNMPDEVPSSLHTPLGCPGPLIQLRDIYPGIHERKWPMPDQPWKPRLAMLDSVEVESSPTHDEAPTLGSPFQLLKPLTTQISKQSHTIACPQTPPITYRSSPTTDFLLPTHSGKSRRPNPFFKRPPVAGPSQKALVSKKATSNPFAKKKANSLHSDSTPLLSEQLVVPPKQPGKTNTPIQQPILTPHTMEPDVLLGSNHVLDECFDQVSLLSGTAASHQPETGPKSAMQVDLKVQETGLVKAPLHQARLSLLSPRSIGDVPRLVIERPSKAGSRITGAEDSSSVSGMTFVYGKPGPYHFPKPEDNKWAELWHDLSLPATAHPAGFVYGTQHRDSDRVLKSTAADPEEDMRGGNEVAPGIRVFRRKDGTHDQDETIGMSISQFCAYIDDLPRDARHRAIITGTTPDGTPIHLNWLKDALPLDERWLLASTDFDSMSATLSNPEFRQLVNYTPWPDRSRTLTHDIGVEIVHQGKARPISQFQNFCIALLGNNCQFRLNVFLPNHEVDRARNKQYKTYVISDIYEIWYEQVFLAAFVMLGTRLPEGWRKSYLQLQQSLPARYKVAENLSIGANKQGKSSKAYPIPFEYMNLLLPIMREIVDRREKLAYMRGYFFHVFGMNLKTGAQDIPGREGGNLMHHTINTHDVLNFNKVNPSDLILDFGVEVLVDPSKLPDTVQHVTLLWNQAKAGPVILPSLSWKSPRIDAYCGSMVVAGSAADSRARARRTGVLWGQFYHKDKNETAAHRDRSTGASFTIDQALKNQDQFKNDMNNLKTSWTPNRSNAVRFEYRMDAWASMVCQGVPEEQWLQKLVSEQAIVAHPTASVVRLKETLRRNYVEILGRTQSLPPHIRSEKPALSMATILSHCIKALVKRPDDQSSTRQFVSRFQLPARAQAYGFFSIPPENVLDDLDRVDETAVVINDLGIFDFIHRKTPAGARVKTSRRTIDLGNRPGAQLQAGAQVQKSTHHTPSSMSVGKEQGGPESEVNWTREDQDWVENLINRRFPLFLWDEFTARREHLKDYSLLQQPLSNRTWSQIVQPGVEKQPLVRMLTSYQNKVQLFFPENFVPPHDSKQWTTHGTRILSKVRDRAKERAPKNVKGYLSTARVAIFRLLECWHFLPCPDTRALWSTNGSGVNKKYRVVVNPQVDLDK